MQEFDLHYPDTEGLIDIRVQGAIAGNEEQGIEFGPDETLDHLRSLNGAAIELLRRVFYMRVGARALPRPIKVTVIHQRDASDPCLLDLILTVEIHFQYNEQELQHYLTRYLRQEVEHIYSLVRNHSARGVPLAHR
jgi:hypothetical protein